MGESEYFLKAKTFIEEKTACADALKFLRRGDEIRLWLDNRIECACFYRDQRAHLEKRPAKKPDVEFSANAEAIRRLAEIPGDNLATVGIEILKEIVAGNVKVHLVGPLTHILTHGYISIIKAAGPDFFNFLAQKGVANIQDTLRIIKSLRKN